MALCVFCADQLLDLLALRLRCRSLRPEVVLSAGLEAFSVEVLAVSAAPSALATAVLGTRGASTPCRMDCMCMRAGGYGK